MDYTIADREGFAVITQTGTRKATVAVPLRIPGFFAFAPLFTCDDEETAYNIVAALIASGARPEDYVKDDTEGQKDGE